MKRVVLFRRKPDADVDAFISAIAGLEVLDQSMTEMDTWWVSSNVGVPGMWDAALVADFADADAVHRYENHPDHVAAATVVGGVAEFAVFDSL